MKNARGMTAVKSAGVVVAATVASLLATVGPAYAATGFSPAPVTQSPTQICNNNFGSNNIYGYGSKNQKIKSRNSGKCKQRTSARHGSTSTQSPTQICNNNFGSNNIYGYGSKNQKINSTNSGSCKQSTSSR